MAEFINTIDALGDDAVTDSIIDRTIVEFKDDKLLRIGGHAFNNCTFMQNIECPNVITIGAFAFENAGANVSKACFQTLSELGNDALRACGFKYVDLPMCTSIGDRAFAAASRITALILRNDAVCTLVADSAFGSIYGVTTPIADGTGYIYVPRALIDSYKAATNWSTLADQFRALEDYTVDGTIDGLYIGEGVTSIYDTNTISIRDSAFANHTTLEEATFTNATSVGSNAFFGCKTLKTVYLPEVTTLNMSPFCDCTSLENLNIPLLKDVIGGSTFRNCTSLRKVKFPRWEKLTTGNELRDCTALESADFSVLSNMRGSMFRSCTALTALILRNTAICTLESTNTFASTPIADGTGYIYVPRALIDSYKAATNWSTLADQFRALEDYTVDGTTTGELDESKI